MNKGLIFSKTEKGEEEIASRKYGLDLSQRRILILVDGKSDVNRLLEKGEGLPDIIESLSSLKDDGFIEVLSGAKVASIKDEMIRVARETLGNDSEKVVKKIRNSPDTLEGLQATVEECKKLVKLIIDEKKAEELAAKCNELMRKR